MVIVALAAGLVLSNVLLAIVGPENVSYTMSTGATVGAGGLVLTSAQVAIIVIAVAAMAAIHALLTFTRIGKAMRATAANPTLDRACGISTGRLIYIISAITRSI